MNFKEEYQKENQTIIPDPSFMANLEKQMTDLQKSESLNLTDIKENSQKNKWIKIIPFVAVGAAACLCFMIYTMNNNRIEKGQFMQKAEIEDTTLDRNESETSQGGQFALKNWYDENAKPDEIYVSFLDRIKDDKNMKAFYCSTSETFSESNILTDEEREKLIEQLQKTYTIEEKADGDDNQSDTKYYMISYQDDVVIKFSILNDKEVIIKDTDFTAEYE